jgi:hypothetical protein
VRYVRPMVRVTEIQVRKSAITQTTTVEREAPPLVEGTVLLKVDRFAITANNVTYAVFGEAMRYWDFFPADASRHDSTQATENQAQATENQGAEWGVVPVWGFGDVVDSQCVGVEVGARFYGFFPMASHVVLEPAKISPSAMFDGAAHRRHLHSVYNNYVRTSTDPAYRQDREAEQMLLRPLFTTSFLIDDFLADNNMFGAHTIVLSSASSKTAYGAAFCLKQRAAVRVVGLTSERNREFTERLGCYDQVLTYEEVRDLDLAPTAYVDLSGNGTTRAAIHHHLLDKLTYDCAVGGTHWDNRQASADLPGPSPQMFFAPAQIAKRNTDWGPNGLNERLAQSWSNFLAEVVSTERPWMRVESIAGPATVAACFAAQATGTASPEIGYVATLN